jgi:hypothetical protein
MPIYTVAPSSSQRSSKTETPKAQRAKAPRSQSSFVTQWSPDPHSIGRRWMKAVGRWEGEPQLYRTMRITH